MLLVAFDESIMTCAYFLLKIVFLSIDACHIPRSLQVLPRSDTQRSRGSVESVSHEDMVERPIELFIRLEYKSSTKNRFSTNLIICWDAVGTRKKEEKLHDAIA
jgi:hypothetical protein